MKKRITGSVAALAVTVTTVGGVQIAALSPAQAAPAHGVVTKTETTVIAPLSYKLSLTGQRQQTNYYCVPASGSMSLSTFGFKVSQTILAKKMKTTTSGTSGNNATPVLNAYVKSRGYKYTSVTDVVGNSARLMSRVSNNVGVLHRAPTIAVWMEQLPWNKGKVKGTKIGHAIIAYGYNSLKGTITVYDPWKPTGGTHTISAKTLAGVLQSAGGMRFISKL